MSSSYPLRALARARDLDYRDVLLIAESIRDPRTRNRTEDFWQARARAALHDHEHRDHILDEITAVVGRRHLHTGGPVTVAREPLTKTCPSCGGGDGLGRM